MSLLLRRGLAVALVAGIGVLLVRAFRGGRAGAEREQETERTLALSSRVSRAATGEVVVALDGETQARIGLRREPLDAEAMQPEVVAYGALEEDPAEVFALRAPVSGWVRSAPDRAWPALGTRVAAGTTVGAVEPRYPPLNRIDLASRLSVARAEAEAASASLGAARSAFERATTLNAEGKNVSDRAVEEAEAKVKAEDAHLRGANATAQLLESSLVAGGGPATPVPLVVESGGEVVAVGARPGEQIGEGGEILRVARFDSLLARARLPAGEAVPAPVSGARVVPAGFEERAFAAEWVASAAAGSGSGGQTLLFRIRPEGPPLRPGAAVTAYLPLPGEPERGVSVPRSAVVRVAGKTWVYVQTADDRFARREIASARPTAKGWFVASGLAAGDRVVVVGAQALLSEEFRARMGTGEY